jgi:hypothetical protein
MTEEDEAFEDLAKRQGDWGIQGSRKHQIMRYAENVESKGTSMTDKDVMRQARNAFVWNLNTDLDNIPACEQWANMLRKNIDDLDKAIEEAEQKEKNT